MFLANNGARVDEKEAGQQDDSNPSEVLIVSDDPSIHGPILDSIKTQGISVSIVRDRLLLPRQLQARKPGLILLNFSLPTMDGIDICRQLKASEYAQDIPVVLMFAVDDLDKRVLGFQAGAADYLVKPLVLEEVTAKVALHARQQTAASESASSPKHGVKRGHQSRDDVGSLSKEPRCEVCPELSLQERYYREIFYNAAEMMVLIEVTEDGEFLFLETNRAFEALMKSSPGSLRGRKIADVFDGHGGVNTDKFLAVLGRCLETRLATVEDLRLDLPSGQVILNSSLIPVFDDTGRVQHILLIFREITEHKRAERQIGFMKFALDQAHDAVFLIDPQADHRIRFVNDKACLSLGYSRDELLSMSVPDIVPLADLEAARKIDEQHRKQAFDRMETVHRRKDGHTFPVEISGTMLEYEGQPMELAIVRDITERKRMEAEVQNHLNFFESMDRVNRAIQGSNDLETVLNDVLDEVLAIFGCDRAFLSTPNDPDVDSWRVSMERTRPEYPGAHALGLAIAMDESASLAFRILLDADGPATFGPGNQHPLPGRLSETFGFKSFMAMALYPKGDKPWRFGIHQCSNARIWTSEDIQLLQKIGWRLTDGLSSLLAYRTLQASEREFRALAENAPFGIARYDAQGRIIYFNPPLEKTLHITTAEVRGKRPTECFPDDIYQEYEIALLQVATNGGQIEFELNYPGEDGPETGIITMVAELDEDGLINGVLAIGRNVTQQRRAEDSLRRSEAQYRSMVTAMVEGVIVQSCNGNIVSINPAAEKILNLSADKVLGTSKLDGVKQVFTRDGKPFPDDQYPSRVSLRTGQPQSDVELGLCRDDGEVVWILANSQPLFMEGEAKPYAVVSTFHDITERKMVEAEKLKAIAILQENEMLLTERLKLERRFSRMANHVPGILYTFKMDANGHGSFPYVSSGIQTIYGLRPEDVVADMATLHGMAHPDDKAGLEAAINEAIRNVAAFHYEYRVCNPSKGVLWIESKAMPTLKDDGSVVFHGFMQDITERKRVENTLKFIAQSGWLESREAFLVSLASFMGQMLEVDYVLIGKLTADPDFAETIVVYGRGEILPNMRYRLAGTPCDNVMEGTQRFYPERVRQHFPEDPLLVDMRVESYAGMPLRDSAGNTLGLIAVMDGKPMADSNRVVSILQLVAIRVAAELERDRFERALADSRQFLHSVIDTIAEPVFVKNRRHRWVLVNAAFSKLMGHTQALLQGKSDYDVFTRAQADEFWSRDEEVFRSGEENVHEDNLPDRNGITRRIITKKTRYIDDNGEGVLVGIMLDITERKQMEAMIRKGEEEFRTLAENLPDIIIRYDTSFRRTYVNKVYAKMLESLGVDVIGKTPREYWRVIKPNADEFTRMLQQVVETGNPETTLIQAETRAGKMLYWTMNLVPEFNQEGVVTGVLSCATDITELKEYQRQVEASRTQLRALASRNEKLREDERKHLARELHDDLGQRLTALKLDLSRLTLRFGQGNPELRQQVQEMELDMGATIQIVRDVATQLRPSALEMGIVSAVEWLAQEFGRRTNIKCRLQLPKQKIALDDSQATALFRIVQESLTNIMRYAMASKVDIVLASNSGHYVLEISDDGVGFDANEKRKDGSFGLIGIEERALSLGGDMHIETSPDKGLKLTVRIPVYYVEGGSHDQSIDG